MAKELPYFKYFPAEWLKGDITLCSMTAQGLFINICTYYWMKDCNMSLTSVQHRFKECSTELQQLIDYELIVINQDNKILISFLDEQFNEFESIRVKCSLAGKKSAKKRSSVSSTTVQRPFNHKDKDKDKDKEKIYMSEFENSGDLTEYENIAFSFWQLAKKNMSELNINSTDLTKSKIKRWVDPIRLSIEKDKRTTQEFREIFDFLNNEKPRDNGFSWKSNIRSGNTLREKFEKLLIASRTGKKSDSGMDSFKNEIKSTLES